MSKLYSDEELLLHLVEFGNELGRTPSIRDMNKAKDRPSGALYWYRFGSWNNAVAKVGLNPRNRYNEKELIGRLQRLSKELGHTPRRIDINNSGYCPNIDTYERHFGSYEKAIIEAGLVPCRPYVQITDEELMEYLKEAISKLNHVPSTHELSWMKSYPNPSTYIERFGSWKDALKKAGFEKSRKFISDEKLLQDLKDAAKELNHTPTYWEMDAMKKYSNPRTIADRFGSWENSIKKAGLEPVRKGYSERELFSHIRRLKNRLGRLPTSGEMLNGGPSPDTYKNHFGSWKKAKQSFEEHELSVEIKPIVMESKPRIMEDIKKEELNYLTLRQIMFNLVDRGISDGFETDLPKTERLKYMKFVSKNFETLCDRMKLRTAKSVELDHKENGDVYTLKLI
jgi:hypothetical protein